jgi:exopolysaccharide biosynthesis polyprenyl glycosylphosphotransferase
MTLLDLRGTADGFLAPGSLAEDEPRLVIEAPHASLDRHLGLLAMLCDAVALVLTVAIASWLESSRGEVVRQVPYAAVFLLAMSAYGLHARSLRRIHRSWFRDFGLLIRSLVSGSIAVVLISTGLHQLLGAPKLGWMQVAVMIVPALAVIPACREIAAAILRRQGVALSRVAVIGSSESARRVVHRLQRYRDLCLVGVITDAEPLPDPSTRFLGATADIVGICERNAVDRVFVFEDSPNVAELAENLRVLPSGVQVSIVPGFCDLLTWQAQINELDGMAVMEAPTAQVRLVRQVAKRAMDILISAVALVCLAPLLLLVAAVVKLTSPGPVFFRQTRIGYQGRPFSIIKFRTMRKGAEDAKVSLLEVTGADRRLFKVATDPRVTTVGRFFRMTSIDELPQLLNVLAGQMSLVGPRPLVPSESAGLSGWASRRFEVRPGMTGLWQVSGRSDLPFEELCKLDYAYAASWSLWWDLKILSQTPSRVLRGRGAY